MELKHELLVQGTDSWNHYHHGSRNSSDDPGISSSRADKHVQSNARNHPQAEGQGRSYGYSSSDSSQRKKNIPSKFQTCVDWYIGMLGQVHFR